MPSYAVLGGTGSTGSRIIRKLLFDNSNTIHIYARSKEKLLETIPELKDVNDSQVRYHIGQTEDITLMKECIKGCDSIFLVLGNNRISKGMSIMQDASASLITALNELKSSSESSTLEKGEKGEKGNEFKCPKVLFLGSASVSDNLSKGTPKLALMLVHNALYYNYEDLRRSISLFRRKENSWIPFIMIGPGALTPGKGTGFELSLTAPKIGLMTYDDLAEGFIRASKEGDKWVGKEVGIAPFKSVENPEILPLAKNLMLGLMVGYTPWIYNVGQRLGLWY